MPATENLGRPIAVPAAKKKAFQALTETPKVALPTLVLAAILIPSVLALDVLAVFGYVSLWVAAAVNTVLYYFFFSIIHDGVHRAICQNKKWNDRICQLAISVYAPYAPMSVFRWAHMEHHRFTNDDKDPDDFAHGPWWSLPIRWMLIDFNYGYRALRNKTPAGKKVLKEARPWMISGFIFIAVAVLAGFGWELIVLWLIPSRLAFIGIGYSFFWLPHAHWPNDEINLKQKDNFTIATTVRLGMEKVLNPILQYQNFHLIHHLWPTTPFYNNEKVWKLLEDDLRRRDLAVSHGLTIQPVYEFANVKPGEPSHA